MNARPFTRATLFGVFLCFFLSGVAGLIYQVAWSKALGLVFGHTVYAIATVLAVFMGGLALGSALLGRWCERHANPIALYGWVELAIAVTGALSLAGLAGVCAFYVWAHPSAASFAPALLALRSDYETLGLRRPEGLLAFYWLDEVDLRRLAAGATRNTDDRMLLEYRAPHTLLQKTLLDKNLELLAQYRVGLLPRDVQIPDRTAALLAVAETLLNQDENEAAGRYLSALGDAPSTAKLEILRGRWEYANHRLADASIAYQKALRLDPRLIDAAIGLAKVSRRRGDDTSAELLLRQVVARATASTAALDALVTLERDRKNWPAALDWQARRMSAESEPGAEQFTRLGEILYLSGDSARAQRAFQTALEHDPYSFAAHNNLGRIYRDLKIWPQARMHLEFVVRYFPDYDANVYVLLAAVYRQTGDPRAADRVLRKGRRVFPEDANLKRVAPAD